jgi:hypothetical protein
VLCVQALAADIVMVLVRDPRRAVFVARSIIEPVTDAPAARRALDQHTVRLVLLARPDDFTKVMPAGIVAQMRGSMASTAPVLLIRDVNRIAPPGFTVRLPGHTALVHPASWVRRVTSPPVWPGVAVDTAAGSPTRMGGAVCGVSTFTWVNGFIGEPTGMRGAAPALKDALETPTCQTTVEEASVGPGVQV